MMMTALNPAASPNSVAILNKERHPAKTAARPRRTTNPETLPTQGPRLELWISAVICRVRIRVQNPSKPQNLALPIGRPRAVVDAAKEIVMVISRTDPARMGLPNVEPDALLPGISRRLNTSWP